VQKGGVAQCSEGFCDMPPMKCAVDAPVACALFRRARALGMPLIRAGYSSLVHEDPSRQLCVDSLSKCLLLILM